MENIVKYYYENLATVDDPGRFLYGMLLKLFNGKINTDNSTVVRMIMTSINKSIKVFGRESTFWALTKLTGMSNIEFNKSIYPLLSTLIIRDYRQRGISSGLLISKDLNPLVRKTLKRIEKARGKNLDLENPFDEW